MTDKDKKELLEMMYQNEDDYWDLPQYAMIADWFVRYWELHNKLMPLLGDEPYDYPLQAFKEGQKQRQENND